MGSEFSPLFNLGQWVFPLLILGGEFFPLCDFGRWAAFLSDELVLAAGCASCISHSLPHTVQRPRVGRARIEIRLEAGEGGTTPYTATLLQIVSRVLEPTKATAGRLAPPPCYWACFWLLGTPHSPLWKKWTRVEHSARTTMSFCRPLQKRPLHVEHLTTTCCTHPSL